MRWRIWGNGESGDRSLDEAREAKRAADAGLEAVQETVNKSKKMETRLSEIRRRNHFREMFEEALK